MGCQSTYMVRGQIRETRYCGLSLVNLHGEGQIRETRYCGLFVNLHGGESDKRDTVLWVVCQPTWWGVR